RSTDADALHGQRPDVQFVHFVLLPRPLHSGRRHSPNMAIELSSARRSFKASLTRPGGNVTGVSTQTTETAGKRIKLLREVIPVFTGWRSQLVLVNFRFLPIGDIQSMFPIMAFWGELATK